MCEVRIPRLVTVKLAIRILYILRLVTITKKSQMLDPAVYIVLQDLNSIARATRLVRK